MNKSEIRKIKRQQKISKLHIINRNIQDNVYIRSLTLIKKGGKNEKI